MLKLDSGKSLQALLVEGAALLSAGRSKGRGEELPSPSINSSADLSDSDREILEMLHHPSQDDPRLNAIRFLLKDTLQYYREKLAMPEKGRTKKKA